MGTTKKAQVAAGFATTKLSLVDKLFIGILLVIFGGIVLHAPISVGFGVLWPDYDLLIKSWKEILLGVGLALGVSVLAKYNQWQILFNKVFYFIAAFAAINLLLIPLYFTGFDATIAALFINLRYLLFFVLVYIALRLYPQYYRVFLYTFLAGAALVIGFAILQVTVLPHDVLKYIGYSTATIAPYLTVDQNYDFLRINSTLRGPNPLGAYAVITLAVAFALWLKTTKKLTRREMWLTLGLGLGSCIALWASYSRSAAIAAVVAVGIIALVMFGKKITKGLWITLVAAALVLSASVVVFRDSYFVSNVILHEDPSEGNNVNSNDGHVDSLIDGFTRMVNQPLGAGIGSTGSASLLTDKPLIIENQYFFVAHETGWLGLAVFLAINWLVLAGLWERRKHWLGLAVFASGVGIAIIGLLLPVWVDDTVSIIWWGLAAIALAILPATATAVKPAQSKKVKK